MSGSSGWEHGDWLPSASWLSTYTLSRDHSSMALNHSDLRVMFPKGLVSWSEAF